MRTTKTPHAAIPTVDKATTIVDWLADKKAKDILAFDLSKKNTLSEAIIIVTASSVRHAQGLAEHILQSAREADYEFLHMEGSVVGQWILLDLNDVVVHIFLKEIRELFRLEDLWSATPVLADTRKEA